MARMPGPTPPPMSRTTVGGMPAWPRHARTDTRSLVVCRPKSAPQSSLVAQISVVANSSRRPPLSTYEASVTVKPAASWPVTVNVDMAVGSFSQPVLYLNLRLSVTDGAYDMRTRQGGGLR